MRVMDAMLVSTAAVLALIGFIRSDQGHRQQQALAQQQRLDGADVCRGGQPVLVHGMQGLVGLGDAPQAQPSYAQRLTLTVSRS